MSNHIEITGILQFERRPPNCDDFFIADIRAVGGELDGKIVKAVGNCEEGELRSQLTYRFYGQWKDDKKWGRQLAVTTFVLATPHGRQGIVRYLEANCDQIGRARAEQLWGKFGPDAVRVCREHPEVLQAAIKQLSFEQCRQISEQLRAAAALESVSIELIDFFAGMNVPKSVYKEALRRWGNKAIELLRINPYLLLGLRGVGFLKADAIYSQIGLPPDRIKRQVHCLAYEMKGLEDTWISEAAAKQLLQKKIAGATVNLERTLAVGLRAKKFTIKRHCARCSGSGRSMVPDLFDGSEMVLGPCPACRGTGGGIWIALYQRAANEQIVAEKAAALLRTPPQWPDAALIEGVSDHQRAALAKAFRGSLCCFIGGPGTGKSHSVAALVRTLLEVFGVGSVAAASPTNKAAVRLTQGFTANQINLKATSIHSLLGVEKVDDGNWEFRHSRRNPFPHRVILIDECFVRGTKIDTPNGQRNIEDIRPGDAILNAIGRDRVVAIKRKEAGRVIKIVAGGTTCFCSENHPFFTGRGLVLAGEIGLDDSIALSAASMRLLRKGNSSQASERMEASILLGELQFAMASSVSRVTGKAIQRGKSQKCGSRAKAISEFGFPGSKKTSSQVCRHKANASTRYGGEGVWNTAKNETQAARAGRQWSSASYSSAVDVESARQGVGVGVCCRTGLSTEGVSDSLQTRHRQPIHEDWSRMRREFPLHKESEAQRCKEGHKTCFARVESVEILESGDSRLDQFRDADGKLYLYDLQAERHHSFSVGGLLVHNCSMLSTDLAACVFDAILPGTLVMMVGDTGQLPPIQHGAVLRDMLAAGVHCGELTEPQRNAGDLVFACQDIKQGRRFRESAEIDLASKPPRNFKFIDARTPDDQIAELFKLLDWAQSIGLDPVWDCQVMSAVNRTSKVSREELNKILQERFNPGDQAAFRVRDKVICEDNGFYQLAAAPAKENFSTLSDPPEGDDPADDSESKAFIAKGEFGQVVAIGKKEVVVKFDGENRTVRIPLGRERKSSVPADGGSTEGGCSVSLAYSCTVHRMQGSECKLAIPMIDESAGAKWLGCRELFFTAISRGKLLTRPIGNRSTADAMCRKVSIGKRKTFLAELVRQYSPPSPGGPPAAPAMAGVLGVDTATEPSTELAAAGVVG